MSPKLQKWQTNQFYEAIKGVGLDPREFKLENGDTEACIKHKWSTSYITISDNVGGYSGRHVVGDTYDWPYEAYSWQLLIERLNRWLKEVKLDLDTPDLWAEMQGSAELLGSTSDEANENTPFTPEEQKEIELRLRDVEQRVKGGYSLSAEQIQLLDAKINYLIEAVDRLGRSDWRGVFVGVIVSYVLQAGLPPESARSMFQTFMTLLRAISHLFGHGFPELPTGGA